MEASPAAYVKMQIRRRSVLLYGTHNRWGLSKRELEDVIDNGDFGKQGKAIINFTSQLPTYQSQLAASVLKDPYRLDFLMLERGYNERDLENAIAKDITRFLLELGNGFTYVGKRLRS